ncbi:MAG: hypothetical protein CVV51_01530 [Spirochaetae bacterium HGW-Spirochaetae-7]|nr:MAG: hypothetical protein CVV51_01530 [Spirochaetae bacterium HGW-Spirochaetae-7]
MPPGPAADTGEYEAASLRAAMSERVDDDSLSASCLSRPAVLTANRSSFDVTVALAGTIGVVTALAVIAGALAWGGSALVEAATWAVSILAGDLALGDWRLGGSQEAGVVILSTAIGAVSSEAR